MTAILWGVVVFSALQFAAISLFVWKWHPFQSGDAGWLGMVYGLGWVLPTVLIGLVWWIAGDGP